MNRNISLERLALRYCMYLHCRLIISWTIGTTIHSINYRQLQYRKVSKSEKEIGQDKEIRKGRC